jgi:hypothetical protein
VLENSGPATEAPYRAMEPPFLKRSTSLRTPGGASGSYAGALVRARFRAYPVIAGLVNRGLAILTR